MNKSSAYICNSVGDGRMQGQWEIKVTRMWLSGKQIL